MPDTPDGNAPSIDQLVAEARESFVYQIADHVDRNEEAIVAGFNNAITPITIALEEATLALFDTARDNARRGTKIERLQIEKAKAAEDARDARDECDEVHRDLEAVRELYEPLVERLRSRVACPFCNAAQLGIDNPVHGLTCPMHRIEKPKP